ncbi:CRISPR system precrRNA processing endoribonuclease RAMP protein Cas6 [Desulfobacter sp.]|uniref:CRISPR system precrRNA processing endoribonuclease RAMP protein Cas6 n=1 Tax=Desulfobacter sp. TaxID=2294 RepID=UPI003D146CA6
MKFGKYLFHIKLTRNAVLPAYKGSTFRGLLGHALKRTVCALKNQTCATCILRQNCTYALVFETAHALPAPENAKVSDPPHPMVLEPPLTEKREFTAGDTLVCGMVLFGDLNRNLPYFIYAFDQMGRIGLGKGKNGTRAGFTLESVTFGNNAVYSKADGRVTLPDLLPEMTLHPDPNGNTDRVTLKLQTPFRISTKTGQGPDLPFDLLMRSLIRRCTALFNTYGNGEPDLDYPDLVKQAGQVRLTDNRLAWFDWQRYSSRQDKKMYMGGLLGQAAYQGDLGPFLPFLRMAEIVHAGKNTAFGLGKVALETMNG